MNKFLERSILDELYEAKSNEFADKIQKEIPEEKSFFAEEQLIKKIKEIIKGEEQQEEVMKKLNEYELEVGKEQDFWNRMYYKLGVYNCTEMKEILLNKLKNSKEKSKTFFDAYTDDFLDYLETNRMKILHENAEYKELANKIETIKSENPNVRTFLEDKESVPLSNVELNAVLDVLEIQDNMDTIEMKETFKLGSRESLLFIKTMKLL